MFFLESYSTEEMKSLGTAACPPDCLAFIIVDDKANDFYSRLI
jgi:tartrate dehydratase alpha subunit/fumarate hydratase class I-like protein